MSKIRRVLADKYFIGVVIAAIVFELVTVWTMFATMGHAGPEGPSGILGWISLALNLPGLALASMWGGQQTESMFGLALRVFLSQLLLISFVAFVVRYFMLRNKV